MQTFAQGLHAAGLKLSVDVATWTVIWDYDAISKTTADIVISMVASLIYGILSPVVSDMKCRYPGHVHINGQQLHHSAGPHYGKLWGEGRSGTGDGERQHGRETLFGRGRVAISANRGSWGPRGCLL